MTVSKEELARVDAKDNREACLKLVKSLYWLKQAGRLWNKRLDKTLADIGYKQSVTDSCVYFNTSSKGTEIVGTYVDDPLATATNEKMLDDFGDAMKSLELKRWERLITVLECE